MRITNGQIENLYIITVYRDDEPDNVYFYAIDFSSGGYPWISNFIDHAVLFKTLDQAQECLRDHFSYSPGSQMPVLVHSALGICYAHPTAKGRAEVVQVKFGPPKATINISDSINR
jgi:hypothetical protein